MLALKAYLKQKKQDLWSTDSTIFNFLYLNLKACSIYGSRDHASPKNDFFFVHI